MTGGGSQHPLGKVVEYLLVAAVDPQGCQEAPARPPRHGAGQSGHVQQRNHVAGDGAAARRVAGSPQQPDAPGMRPVPEQAPRRPEAHRRPLVEQQPLPLRRLGRRGLLSRYRYVRIRVREELCFQARRNEVAVRDACPRVDSAGEWPAEQPARAAREMRGPTSNSAARAAERRATLSARGWGAMGVQRATIASSPRSSRMRPRQVASAAAPAIVRVRR